MPVVKVVVPQDAAAALVQATGLQPRFAEALCAVARDTVVSPQGRVDLPTLNAALKNHADAVASHEGVAAVAAALRRVGAGACRLPSQLGDPLALGGGFIFKPQDATQSPSALAAFFADFVYAKSQGDVSLFAAEDGAPHPFTAATRASFHRELRSLFGRGELPQQIGATQAYLLKLPDDVVAGALQAVHGAAKDCPSLCFGRDGSLEPFPSDATQGEECTLGRLGLFPARAGPAGAWVPRVIGGPNAVDALPPQVQSSTMDVLRAAEGPVLDQTLDELWDKAGPLLDGPRAADGGATQLVDRLGFAKHAMHDEGGDRGLPLDAGAKKAALTFVIPSGPRVLALEGHEHPVRLGPGQPGNALMLLPGATLRPGVFAQQAPSSLVTVGLVNTSLPDLHCAPGEGLAALWPKQASVAPPPSAAAEAAPAAPRPAALDGAGLRSDPPEPARIRTVEESLAAGLGRQPAVPEKLAGLLRDADTPPHVAVAGSPSRPLLAGEFYDLLYATRSLQSWEVEHKQRPEHRRPVERWVLVHQAELLLFEQTRRYDAKSNCYYVDPELVDELAQRTNDALPDGVPRSTREGRLKVLYGFTSEAVRLLHAVRLAAIEGGSIASHKLERDELGMIMLPYDEDTIAKAVLRMRDAQDARVQRLARRLRGRDAPPAEA
eukprot:gene6619-5316_t